MHAATPGGGQTLGDFSALSSKLIPQQFLGMM